jgi:hypothetical protein
MHISAVSAAMEIASTVQWVLLGWRRWMHVLVRANMLEKCCLVAGQILLPSED